MTTPASQQKTIDKKGSLLTVRPDIRVLDCTIRDGGLLNNCAFDDAFVQSIYSTCVNAGVDYMEVGYKGARRLYAPGEFGTWKFCAEDDLRRVVNNNDTPLKLAAMADAERTDYHTDIVDKSESVLDMIRVATYIHQIPTALDMIKSCHDKGYETTLNLMAVSVVQEHELDEALAILAQSEVDVVYLVDSFGSLYSEEIQALTRKYLAALDGTSKKVGIHTHNNQQLAFSNTIESLVLGTSFLDTTIGGMGRGAGNCNTELMLGFLRNPKYHIRPILSCIQDTIVPISQSLTWGFDIPYMVTGQMNMHPRSAMAAVEGSDRYDYVGFYDRTMEER